MSIKHFFTKILTISTDIGQQQQLQLIAAATKNNNRNITLTISKFLKDVKSVVVACPYSIGSEVRKTENKAKKKK